jgi:hypothetical protein
VTWRHVALIAIAAVVVLACEISSTCQGALDKVIGFSLAVVGAAAGNAMRNEDPTKRDKAP